MIQIPEFNDNETKFAWLRANKTFLMTAKKSAIKYADAVFSYAIQFSESGIVSKAEARPELLDLDSFPVKVVINTTNIFDSHYDVHIPGLWKKTLAEKKPLYHLQEHKMSFDHIISDKVKAYTKQLTFADLGYDFAGVTEALIFDSQIEKDRNSYMAEQYAKGRVTNHSVGMQYVKLEFAINSESKYDQEEKAVWDKYIDQVANRSEVEANGYFWAVTEAKLIEGSAVPIGSNFVTPTIQIGKETALDSSRETTVTEPQINVSEIVNHIKNIKL